MGRNLSGEYVANESIGLPTRNNANEYTVVLRLPSEYPRLEPELTPENPLVNSPNGIIISNPTSGRQRHVGTVHRRGEGNGYIVRETEGSGDPLDFVRDAAKEGVPLIVAAGGDGTVNELVREIAPVGAFDVSVARYISDVDDFSNTDADSAVEQWEPTAVFSLLGDEIRPDNSRSPW